MDKRPHLILKLRDELLVAREDVGAILDETAEGPQPQGRLAVLLDDVQMWPIGAPTHLPCLLYDGVDTLVEGVVQNGQRRLQHAEFNVHPPCKHETVYTPFHRGEPRNWAG